MSLLSKEKELINFIETKKVKKKDVDIKKILYYFSKIIRESIIRPYTRLNDIFWAQECSNIVFNIFWQLFSYSNNTKLSMFMCERAILLFNEYIDLAKSTFTENSDFKINSTDVKLFIYKRTIGPVKLKKITNRKFQLELNKIKESSIKIKYIFNKLSVSIINILEQLEGSVNLKSELNKYLEYIEVLLPDIIQKLYMNNIDYNIDNFIHQINISSTVDDIVTNLNILRIDLEIFYYIYKKTKFSKKHIMIILEKLKKYDKSNLNKFLSKNLNLNNIKYYKNVIRDVNLVLKNIKKEIFGNK